MTAFLFLVLYVLFSGGQMILNKVYQTRVKMTAPSYMLYLIVMGSMAALLFFLMSGCDTTVDRALFIYSTTAAFVVIGSTLVALLSMAYMNLAAVTVTQNAGSLVIPSLYGVLFLHEQLSPLRIAGMVLVVAAFLITFLGDRASQTDGKKSSLLGTLICPIMFVTSGLGNIVHKAFLLSGSAASNEAYLSWLNIFMVPMVIAAFFLLMRKRKQNLRQFTAGIGMRNYWLVCAGSVVGCIGMVCSMKAMMGMEISLYSPLYSAMYMIFLVCVSHFVFHEKITRQNIISVLLGILAVICTAL